MEEARQALLIAEKSGKPYQDLISIWNIGKECIENELERITLYTTFIYMTRRYMSTSDDYGMVENLFIEGLRDIDKSNDRLSPKAVEFRKNFAFFLYHKSKKTSQAREVWNSILTKVTDAWTWLEAITMERAYGTIESDNVEYVRNLFLKALNIVRTDPEALFTAFIQFEREEGTIDQLESALYKVNTKNQRFVEQQSKWDRQHIRNKKMKKNEQRNAEYDDEPKKEMTDDPPEAKSEAIFSSIGSIGPQIPGMSNLQKKQSGQELVIMETEPTAQTKASNSTRSLSPVPHKRARHSIDQLSNEEIKSELISARVRLDEMELNISWGYSALTVRQFLEHVARLGLHEDSNRFLTPDDRIKGFNNFFDEKLECDFKRSVDAELAEKQYQKSPLEWDGVYGSYRALAMLLYAESYNIACKPIHGPLSDSAVILVNRHMFKPLHIFLLKNLMSIVGMQYKIIG